MALELERSLPRTSNVQVRLAEKTMQIHLYKNSITTTIMINFLNLSCFMVHIYIKLNKYLY